MILASRRHPVAATSRAPGPFTRARLVAWLSGLALAAMATTASCSVDGPAPTAGIGGITLPPETLAFPSGTPKPLTTPAPAPTATSPTPNTPPAGVTTPADGGPTTAPPAESASTAVPTTEVILAICDLNVVIADIGPADEGYAFADLRCGGPWATIVAKAFDQSVSTDELFVMRAEDGRWSVLDGGGSTTCTSAGIPAELFADLACERWERRASG